MNQRYLTGLALLFWGFQTDLMVWAIPMALILEARFLTDRRWALTRKDFYRIADLTSVASLGIIGFLVMNSREYHFITALLQWLPIVFFPLVSVLAFSTHTRMPLDVLFYSLRRQAAPVTHSWDMNAVFFGLCLIASGMDSEATLHYLAVVACLVLLALYRLRSPRYPRRLWMVLASISLVLAFATQLGIRATHLQMKQWSQAWIDQYIQRNNDPYRAKTAMGSIGQLKLSDEIMFRVQMPTGSDNPGLLQEAVYDLLSGTEWLTLHPEFSALPKLDEFRWQVSESSTAPVPAIVYLALADDTALLPLPVTTSQVLNLPATELRANLYGTVQARGLLPSPGYHIRLDPQANRQSLPRVTDTLLSGAMASVAQQAIDEHAAGGLPPRQALAKIFADFRYSLMLDDGAQSPLAAFLLERQRGHCEHFASATVLLLRQMGIPARYAVGFSMHEYNADLDMYLIRKRHAHAWAIAYLDGRWQAVDTTPGIWAQEEAARASPWRPGIDWLVNNGFRVKLWWADQSLQDYETELFVLGAVLALLLIWRISRSEQVRLNTAHRGADDSPVRPGAESPFYRIEHELARQGLGRGRSELPARWLERIDQRELLALLALHYRWRFDPRGISLKDQQQLAAQVDAWEQAQSQSQSH